MTDDPIPFKIPGKGSRWRFAGPGLLGLAGVGLAVVAATWFSLTTYVGPDEFAIRQTYLGPNKGVQEQIYGPGLHLVIPAYERLHVFPRDLQTLELTSKPSNFREDYLHAPAIRIQTSEGYQVTVDITVTYRVVDPFKVLTEVGAGRLYETKVVQRRADKILRQTLGQLNAEDFYSDKVRMASAEQARTLLKEDLEDWGIEVWAVLVRHYNYDDRYQQAIEDRKIQDQKVFKNMAEAVAANREAEKNRVLAEGEANIQVEAERGKAEVRKIKAEGDLYYRKKVAEGGLLVALAEAEGTRLENEALKQAGAGNLVGMKMAKTLEGVEVIVVSTTGESAVNPLDLDALVEGW